MVLVLNTDPNFFRITTLLIIFSLLFSCTESNKTEQQSLGEFFEGRIVYNYDFISKGLHPDSLESMRRNGSEMLFKGGNYHFTIYGGDTLVYIYHGKEGNCYFKRLPFSEFHCRDYKVWDDTVTNIVSKGKGEKVLGHDTEVWELYSIDLKTSYHLAEGVKLDAKAFEKHASTNFNILLNLRDGAAALKTIYEFPRFTVIETAVTIEELNIDDSVFHVPDSMVITKCR